MRGLQYVGPATLAGLVFLLALLLGGGANSVTTARAAETSIGIDAVPTGNSATSIGSRDVCVQVRSGDSFDVDILIENVADLAAWEAYVSFDPAVVHVVERDVQMFLASGLSGETLDFSESVPDDEGRFRVGGGLVSEVTGVSGSGVLARLTLQAQDSGRTELSLATIQTDAGDLGNTFTLVDGSQVDSNGDSYFDGPALNAQVAVDETCAGEALPPITIAGSDGGVAIWIFLLIAATIVGVAAIGGVALISLRRSNPGAGS